MISNIKQREFPFLIYINTKQELSGESITTAERTNKNLKKYMLKGLFIK